MCISGDVFDNTTDHSLRRSRFGPLGAICYSSSKCQDVYLEGVTHLERRGNLARLVYLWRLVYSGRLVARPLKDSKEVAMGDN